MESRSSESNYGFGGYSSESNYGYESYGSSFSSGSALESRPSIEIVERRTSSSSETKNRDVKTTDSKPQYNSLDDIDKLIERLETSMGTSQVTSERANQILEQKKQKIDLLKQLVADARKAEAEEKMIQQLEQENSELDDAINSINRGFHR